MFFGWIRFELSTPGGGLWMQTVVASDQTTCWALLRNVAERNPHSQLCVLPPGQNPNLGPYGVAL